MTGRYGHFSGQYLKRRVLVTGDSGFKGSWLALWLSQLGAEITGFSTFKRQAQSLFELAGVNERIRHVDGDIRDLASLRSLFESTKPQIVFHLAAQPLVRQSYRDPLETLSINVLGTATLLEAIRLTAIPAAVVVVTSDKCYENRNWPFGYREIDPLGGHDPYSMSKACTELVASSWQRSFFADGREGIRLATARAGNVVGGGDWAAERIVTDCIQCLIDKQPIGVRSPHAERPWQHVLEALSGYLLLGSRLAQTDGAMVAGAWNFGPDASGIRPVRELVESMIQEWGSGSWQDLSDPAAPHEAQTLALCCDKAKRQLGWQPIWDFKQTIQATVQWYKAWSESPHAIRELCESQICEYVEQASSNGVSWTRDS